MTARVRQNAPVAVLAIAGSLILAWLGLYGYAWTDFDDEAMPAVDALIHGRVADFLRLVPAYGGSLIERAPFALLPSLWDGGALAVYRSMAAPCLLAAALLGVYLVARMRTAGVSRLARGVALGLCVANPLTLRALELGHPEELFGGALCVGAVLVADRGHAGRAALLLGLAIANKPWALLAIGPVLLALPGRRVVCTAWTAAVAGLVLAPLMLVESGSFVSSNRATASSVNPIFQPWQVWWFFGHHGDLVVGMFGNVKEGFRSAPSWANQISRPVVMAMLIPLTALAWRLRAAPRGNAGGRRSALGPALLLLALLLLLRCLFDTWNTVYYPIPCLLALVAWETLCARRVPVLALGATALAWVSFETLASRASPDVQAAFFLLWSTALVVGLAATLYAPRHVRRLGELGGVRLGRRVRGGPKTATAGTAAAPLP